MQEEYQYKINCVLKCRLKLNPFFFDDTHNDSWLSEKLANHHNHTYLFGFLALQSKLDNGAVENLKMENILTVY